MIGMSDRSFTPEDIWEKICDVIGERIGKFDIAPSERRSRDKFASYLLQPSTSTGRRLSAIELAFQTLNLLEEWLASNVGYKKSYEVLLSPSKAIDLLNRRFSQHDLGYRYAQDRIDRIDDEFLYTKVAQPALNALKAHGFDRALREFLSAHQHYTRGEIEDAITDANNAFESTMKVICEHRNIRLSGSENATELINHMVSKILPAYLSSSIKSFSNLLQGLPTVRNKTPSSGHGGGSSSETAPAYMAAYALNLAATNITLLVQAWQDESASENKAPDPGATNRA